MHAAVRYLGVLGGCAVGTVTVALAASPATGTTPDKYALKVPGGLAFSEFKGYESWQLVSLSRSEKAVAAILANPVMIDAYRAGIPGNGKPFPDGAKMAKVHWNPKKNEFFPDTTIPGTQHDVDKCGFACHTKVKTRDYVFTDYGTR
ncbi:MAG TPA: cytochrome P460 family protein [Polyangia bacterium]|jgi:hypothetical protein